MLNFVGLSDYKQLLGNYLLLIISTWRNILPKLNVPVLKEALYRSWCGANRLGNSGVICSAIIQLLLTRRGKTRMDGVGIVFNSIQGLFNLSNFVMESTYTCN